MGMKVFNALSLNYVPMGHSILQVRVEMTRESFDYMVSKPDKFGLQSYIGHEDLANLLGLSANRATCPELKAGEQFIVAQYRGPRLPEGSKTLPDGAMIEFRWMQISEDSVFKYPPQTEDPMEE
jgi:hypothetical protein